MGRRHLHTLKHAGVRVIFMSSSVGVSSSIGALGASLSMDLLSGGLIAAKFAALTITESGVERPAATLAARCISAALAAVGNVVLKYSCKRISHRNRSLL